MSRTDRAYWNDGKIPGKLGNLDGLEGDSNLDGLEGHPPDEGTPTVRPGIPPSLWRTKNFSRNSLAIPAKIGTFSGTRPAGGSCPAYRGPK